MISLLPANMQNKIEYAHCDVADLDPKCWNWTGARSSRGYGSVGHQKRVWSTHKLAYILLVGEVPDGLQIDHLCRNKRCCNPAHLEAVTGKVNCERTEAAQKTRCAQGHPLVPPNLLIKKRKSGLTIRNCRVCQLDYQRRARATKRKQPAADKNRASILCAAEAALTETLKAA